MAVSGESHDNLLGSVVFLMKKFVAVIMLTLAVLVLLTSCQGDTGPQPDLVIWTGVGDQELLVLRQITEEFNSVTGRRVVIVKVPFNELKIKYQIAAPAGQGPDLMIGPQDWIGAMATADIIEPLRPDEFTQEQRDSYNPKSLESMYYQGRMYGLPMLMETLAIIYDRDMVPVPPETMEDLIQQALEYKGRGRDRFGFFFEATNSYFAWPYLSGYGARIFGTTNNEIDVNKIELNSPETVEGIRFLKDLKTRHDLLPNGATTDMMSGIFMDGLMPFCLNGPWMMGDLREKNINFGVMPIPPLSNGQHPQPFFGVQGVIMNKLVNNRKLAVEFMHHLNLPENQKKMCLASGRIPTRYDTLELIADQQAILQFARAVDYSTPMPNHPAINAVWEPLNEVLQLVIVQGKEPEDVLPGAVERIREDIRIMME